MCLDLQVDNSWYLSGSDVPTDQCADLYVSCDGSMTRV